MYEIPVDQTNSHLHFLASCRHLPNNPAAPSNWYVFLWALSIFYCEGVSFTFCNLSQAMGHIFEKFNLYASKCSRTLSSKIVPLAIHTPLLWNVLHYRFYYPSVPQPDISVYTLLTVLCSLQFSWCEHHCAIYHDGVGSIMRQWAPCYEYCQGWEYCNGMTITREGYYVTMNNTVVLMIQQWEYSYGVIATMVWKSPSTNLVWFILLSLSPGSVI